MADDAERQFQADLERAAALSMETLALEEFKRKQRNSGRSSFTPTPTTEQLDFSYRTTSSSTGQVLSDQQQQRRMAGSSRAPATAAPDLISFSGPDPEFPDELTTTDSSQQRQQPNSSVPDKHTSFVQYVGQIHQMNAQQQYLARTAVTPFVRPTHVPIPIAGPAGLALMPYQAPPQTQPVTQPLTPDNLQKLYNNPPVYYPSGGVGAPGAYPRYPQSHHFPQQQQQQYMSTFPGQQNSMAVGNQQVHASLVAQLSTGELFYRVFVYSHSPSTFIVVLY